MAGPRIVLTVGVPASGKTTFAEELVNSKELGFRNICLDDIRRGLWVTKQAYWKAHGADPSVSNDIYSVQRSLLGNLLNPRRGENRRSVVVSNTHLLEEHVKDVVALGFHWDIPVSVVAFDVPREELWKRNAVRGPEDRVPLERMEEFWNAFRNSDAWWRHSGLPLRVISQ